jgi:filamentous hemagglutinin family protein
MKPRAAKGFGLRPTLLAVSIAACFALGPQGAQANPTGPAVVSGSASFAAAGSVLTVTNSANAIIQWRGFSIGVNEITRFLQPSAASAVLNRVVGSGGVIPQSVIDGVLSSNGRVFLLNPMGVVIGASARIDVAGLVASSLHLSNDDFLAGRLRFAEIPGAGGIANHGVIETPAGGRVFLVAPDVQNSGIIRAPQGEIVLAAGKSAELVSESSPYVTVNVVADAERALNVGQLVAQSGRIGMYGALVRHSGVAEASGAVADAGGHIRFVATKDLTLDPGSRVAANGASGGEILLQAQGGTNSVAGTVEATGSSGAGGTVHALGLRVGVIGNGVIDASGETGGGTVLLGGDFQGRNSAIQNAERTFVGTDGVIRADARAKGDGGRVIVWADGDTRFYGGISARGGAQSGDGGFVEVSGKQQLAFHGSVDTRAPNGRTGTLLLDPPDIVIKNGTNDGHDDDTSSATFGDQPSPFAYGGGNPYGASVIWESELEGTAATTAVSVTATNSIVIEPLTTDGVLYLAQGADFSAGAGGIAMQDTSNTIRSAGNPLTFYSSGSVTLGNLDTSAGSGNNYSYVQIDAWTGITAGSITTGGAVYGSYVDLWSNSGSVRASTIKTGNASDAFGDSSATVMTNSPDTIVVGDIVTGTSAFNSSVILFDPIGTITAGNITTGGSTNPFAASDALVFIGAGAGVNVGTISGATANEGDGVGIITTAGDINASSIITRGAYPGADAGDVVLSAPAGSVKVNGIIDARGTDDPSGIGGDGGSVSIQAMNTVVVGPAPTFGVNNNVIMTSGGAGSLEGGHAGSVSIDPVAITLNGVILAVGGAGGAGPGGDGGDLNLITTGGTGTVTFVNGGWDLTGGAGSPPGSNGSVNILGTLIFAFVNSPLANTTVSQAIGQTIDAAIKATEPVQVAEDESETDKKKKPLASCRPG